MPCIISLPVDMLLAWGRRMALGTASTTAAPYSVLPLVLWPHTVEPAAHGWITAAALHLVQLRSSEAPGTVPALSLHHGTRRQQPGARIHKALLQHGISPSRVFVEAFSSDDCSLLAVPGKERVGCVPTTVLFNYNVPGDISGC